MAVFYNNKLIHNNYKTYCMDENITEVKNNENMVETNFKLEREHEDEMPYSIESQVNTVVSNIKYYLSVLISDSPPLVEVEELKQKLIHDLDIINSEYLRTQKIEYFYQEYPTSQKEQNNQQIKEYEGYAKIQQFGDVIKKLLILREDTEQENQFENLQKIIGGFIKQMQIIINEDNYTIHRLQKYQVEENNLDQSNQSNDKEVQEIPQGHYWQKQKIEFRTWQPAKVFEWVEPPLHRVYLSQVTKVYHEVAPFKIKFVCLNSLDDPKINTPNYFNTQLDSQKAIIHYCKPGTKNLIYYKLQDIFKALTIQKQFAIIKQMPVSWQFSQQTKTVITPDGRIFGINCRTTQNKQDSSMYEITTQKVSNRGRIPQAKRNSSIVYCNKAIYIIGGNNEKQKCSTKNFKYSLKDKKWKQISDSNVALRKPTICSFKDRYIFKIGGINQFDYLNKVIQIYDTTTDKWSTVRANAKNIMEEVQILQDSLAVQISEDQIYVFAGKNGNNYRSDTGLVFQIMEIREKIKAPAKVSGELWNVSIGKKNVLSFFGVFNQSNVIAHYNCLYAIRAQTSNLQRM